MALAISLSWSGVGAGTPVFTDVTVESGIDFVHTNGASREKRLPETDGSGVAFLDADGDGKLSPMERDKARDEGAVPELDFNFDIDLDFGTVPNVNEILRDARRRGASSSGSSSGTISVSATVGAISSASGSPR